MIYRKEGITAQTKAFHDMWTLTQQNNQLLLQFENTIDSLDDISSIVKDFLKAWIAPLKQGKSKDKKMLVYLLYMTERLILMKKILKETGSYLHCDPTASHYLKVIMDGIFGSEDFRNEIVWCYRGVGGRAGSYFEQKHDIILCYAKNCSRAYFMPQRQQLSESTIKRFQKYFDENGQITYQNLKATNPGVFNSLKGIPEDLNEIWMDKNRGALQTDWWTDIPIVRNGKKESEGYNTQKPVKLLDRIIGASCPPAIAGELANLLC